MPLNWRLWVALKSNSGNFKHEMEMTSGRVCSYMAGIAQVWGYKFGCVWYWSVWFSCWTFRPRKKKFGPPPPPPGNSQFATGTLPAPRPLPLLETPLLGNFKLEIDPPIPAPRLPLPPPRAKKKYKKYPKCPPGCMPYSNGAVQRLWIWSSLTYYSFRVWHSSEPPPTCLNSWRLRFL